MFNEQRSGIPRSVRISQGDYDDLVRRANIIRDYAVKKGEEGEIVFDPAILPTVEELEEHGIKYRIREFLLYLVFYREPEICGFDEDDEEYLETKRYIDDLFDYYVVIMDDADCEEIRSMTPEKWKKMTQAERAKVIEPVMSYYGGNEFEDFIEDLGWLPFMQYARCSATRYRKNGMSTKLANDMKNLWEKVQGSGW